jgi:hypothetical protein
VRTIIEKQSGGGNPKLGKRALWFVGIYVASVVAFAAVSGVLSLFVTH